jgi:Zn-dependent protease
MVDLSPEFEHQRNHTFARGEVAQIVVAWVAISLALSVADIEGLSSGIGSLDYIAAAFIATATGFVLHEMGHKFVAMRHGYIAHFRIWTWGIALALVIAVVSRGQFVFGAPGAVYIAPAPGLLSYGYAVQRSEKRDNAVISAAGPGTNLAFALFFLFLIFVLPTAGFWSTVANYGFILNVGLGSFNMLPIPPMDGYKIFKGSIPLGLLIALPLWAMFGYLFLLP